MYRAPRWHLWGNPRQVTWRMGCLLNHSVVASCDQNSSKSWAAGSQWYKHFQITKKYQEIFGWIPPEQTISVRAIKQIRNILKISVYMHLYIHQGMKTKKQTYVIWFYQSISIVYIIYIYTHIRFHVQKNRMLKFKWAHGSLPWDLNFRGKHTCNQETPGSPINLLMRSTCGKECKEPTISCGSKIACHPVLSCSPMASS